MADPAEAEQTAQDACRRQDYDAAASITLEAFGSEVYGFLVAQFGGQTGAADDVFSNRPRRTPAGGRTTTRPRASRSKRSAARYTASWSRSSADKPGPPTTYSRTDRAGRLPAAGLRRGREHHARSVRQRGIRLPGRAVRRTNRGRRRRILG